MRRRWLGRGLWLLVPLLLWWAARGVSLGALAGALGRLTFPEAAAVAVVNMGLVLLMTARWWAVLRAQGQRPAFLSLVAYRLASFAVSFFTPGPQFGGEPLQVWLLSRRQGVPGALAAASVAVDRSLELVTNFAFLVVGAAAVGRLRLVPGGVGRLMSGSLLLLGLPLAYLGAAAAGRRPLSGLLDRLPGAVQRRLPSDLGWAVAEGEGLVTEFLRRRPAGLAAALGLSLVIWAGLIGEYLLMLHVLEIDLSPLGGLAALTAGRLALFTPLPGGLGALEASQVLALEALGRARAEALALGVLIRARDLALAGSGLALAALLAGRGRGLTRKG